MTHKHNWQLYRVNKEESYKLEGCEVCDQKKMTSAGEVDYLEFVGLGNYMYKSYYVRTTTNEEAHDLQELIKDWSNEFDG